MPTSNWCSFSIRTGNKRKRSTGTTRRRDAERIASGWERELNSKLGNACDDSIPWELFRARLQDEKLNSLRPSTACCYNTSLDVMEGVITPQVPGDVNESTLSQFQAHLRNAKSNRETAIAMHLRSIGSALSWAQSVKLIPEKPAMPRVQRIKGKKMRGRPLSLEELERTILAMDKVIRNPVHRESWKHLLRGLWLFGLRISEAFDLPWSHPHHIRPNGKVLEMPGAKQKNKQDLTCPMAPDFYEFLGPDGDGYVFNPLDASGKRASRSKMPCWHHLLRIPTIIGTRRATTTIRDGDIVEVNATEQIVHILERSESLSSSDV